MTVHIVEPLTKAALDEAGCDAIGVAVDAMEAWTALGVGVIVVCAETVALCKMRGQSSRYLEPSIWLSTHSAVSHFDDTGPTLLK